MIEEERAGDERLPVYMDNCLAKPEQHTPTRFVSNNFVFSRLADLVFCFHSDEFGMASCLVIDDGADTVYVSFGKRYDWR